MARIGDLVRRAATKPLRVMLPKNPLWRLGILVVLVLVVVGLFEPILSLIARGGHFVLQSLEPVLETTIGRITALLLTCTGLLMLASFLLRERIREFYAKVALGQHLDGIEALLRGDVEKSQERFQKVANQARAPQAYPWLPADARIKLARLALEQARPSAALGSAARVLESGLAPELQRSLAQVRLLAMMALGTTLPETLRTQAQAAVAAFPKDPTLLAAYARILREQGDWEAAAEQEERAHKHGCGPEREASMQRLRADLRAGLQQALEQGEPNRARGLHKRLARHGCPRADIALGAILEAEGDPRGAIAVWGKTMSPEGLLRIAAVLREQPQVMSPRELLAACPMQATLLVVAREAARRGEPELARRAAQEALRRLGSSPTARAMLAETLTLLGHQEESQQWLRTLVQQALPAPPQTATEP